MSLAVYLTFVKDDNFKLMVRKLVESGRANTYFSDYYINDPSISVEDWVVRWYVVQQGRDCDLAKLVNDKNTGVKNFAKHTIDKKMQNNEDKFFCAASR